MADLSGIDLERVRELENTENARFVAERPRSMALQAQARRSMPRGVPMAWMDDLYEHPPVGWPAARVPASPTWTGDLPRHRGDPARS